MFSFLLTPEEWVSYSTEQGQQKRKIYSLMAFKIIAGHRNNTVVKKMAVSPQGLSLFVFLALKGKQIKQ